MSTTLTVPLATGTEMPMVGFGTWQVTGRRGYATIRHALEIGYRHLDTATMYRNEAEVGRAVRDSGLAREDVFITTKLLPSDAGRERQAITASLRALGMDYVDLWLVHWPPRRGAGVSTWEALRSARADGLARSVGVSNYDTALIDELVQATGEAPAVNQVPWSPWQHDPVLLTESRQRGVVVEGYSPLQGSDLRHPVLTGIARRYGVTPAQVVLRWHLDHGIVVIPKAATPQHMESNLDIFGFGLTSDEVAQLDALG